MNIGVFIIIKFALMSDVHLEFNDWTPPELDVDLVILAGDIHPGTKGVIWANEHFKQPVLYVPGNHEFYGKRSVNRHPLKMKEKAAELGGKVTVMHNDKVVIDGVTFLGATLWTDYKLNNYNQPLAMLQAESGMNDYTRCVWDTHSRLKAKNLLLEHIESKNFLTTNLTTDCVVVTHHAPTEWHLGDQTDALGFCYASDLYDMIAAFQPKVWCSGHTHHNVDFAIGKTRLVANCRGYTNDYYEPLIVEV